MRDIPDLIRHLLKTLFAAGVTDKLYLLIVPVPVWSRLGCRAEAVCVFTLKPTEGPEEISRTLQAAVCCRQMLRVTDGTKCPWLDAASCHLPVSQGVCRWEALERRRDGSSQGLLLPLAEGPWAGLTGDPVVQDSAFRAGGAVCSGRSVHACMAGGAKQASGTLHPWCPGSTPDLGTCSHAQG